MELDNVQLGNAVGEAVSLGYFKTFCEKNDTGEARQRIRTIYGRTVDPIETTQNMFQNEFGVTLSASEADRLFALITAFLKKSPFRKPVENAGRKALLQTQDYHCAICGCDIDIHAHADHIVPFHYVGDELEHNLQMLCAGCNLKKNASLDYQVRYLQKLI